MKASLLLTCVIVTLAIGAVQSNKKLRLIRRWKRSTTTTTAVPTKRPTTANPWYRRTSSTRKPLTDKPWYRQTTVKPATTARPWYRTTRKPRTKTTTETWNRWNAKTTRNYWNYWNKKTTTDLWNRWDDYKTTKTYWNNWNKKTSTQMWNRWDDVRTTPSYWNYKKSKTTTNIWNLWNDITTKSWKIDVPEYNKDFPVDDDTSNTGYTYYHTGYYAGGGVFVLIVILAVGLRICFCYRRVQRLQATTTITRTAEPIRVLSVSSLRTNPIRRDDTARLIPAS